LETDTTTPEAFKAQIRDHAETAIARMQGEGE